MSAQLWSLSALSVELGMDRRSLARRIDDAGLQPAEEKGRSKLYRMSDVVRVLQERTGLNLTEEKARLASEQADKTALHNEEERGELVRVEDMTKFVGDMVGAARSKFLAISRKYPDAADDIRRALEELSEQNYTPKEDADGDTQGGTE
jgi:phage terminase Nu1 subunit (DNA packaging protein)